MNLKALGIGLWCAFCLTGIVVVPSGLAQDSTGQDEHELAELSRLLEEPVAIASKTPQALRDAPSTVTVITAREIRAMGANTVTDVLATIPGVDVFIKEYGYTELVIRGGRQEGQRVKFLVNGHAMNPPRTGQASIFLDDLTVENIKRIEIIRGPGSALYGANAFNGVINIITWDAADLDGAQIIIKGGNFKTAAAGLLFGKAFGDLELSGYTEYSATDGFDTILRRDAQSVLDQRYAPYGIPPVSLAPGPVQTNRRKTDLNLDLKYRGLTLRAKYLKKANGPYIGANYTLNHGSEWNLDTLFVEGQYEAQVSQQFDLSVRASWDRVREDYRMQATPPGFTIPLDTDGDGDLEIFPDGTRGRLATSFDVFGGEIQGNYHLWDRHLLTTGAAVQNIRQFANVMETNFRRFPVAALAPGELDTSPSFAEHSRTIRAIFVQHQWQMTDNVGLTLGVRHDDYSDFGGTTNPRAALTWRMLSDLHLKVLYGTAFFAPSFHETYLKNNPLIVGSEDLQPATIRTLEVGLLYPFSAKMTGSLAYFHNATDDVIIEEVQPAINQPATFVNGTGDIVQGIELELKTDWGQWGRGYLNYTFRDTEVRDTRDAVPFIAKRLAQVGVTLPVRERLLLNVQAAYVGERPREAGDLREPADSYMLLDAAVTVKNVYRGLELFAAIRNLLDQRYASPSPAGSLPDDYPMPGRAMLIGLRYPLAGY